MLKTTSSEMLAEAQNSAQNNSILASLQIEIPPKLNSQNNILQQQQMSDLQKPTATTSSNQLLGLQPNFSMESESQKKIAADKLCGR